MMRLVWLLLLVSPAYATPKQGLFEVVIKEAQACAQGKQGVEVVSCYVNATPEQCKEEALEAFSTGRFERSSTAWQRWYLCVSSASGANT